MYDDDKARAPSGEALAENMEIKSEEAAAVAEQAEKDLAPVEEAPKEAEEALEAAEEAPAEVTGEVAAEAAEEVPGEAEEASEETEKAVEEADEAPEVSEESVEVTEEVSEGTEDAPEAAEEIAEETGEAPLEVIEEAEGSTEETDEAPEGTEETSEAIEEASAEAVETEESVDAGECEEAPAEAEEAPEQIEVFDPDFTEEVEAASAAAEAETSETPEECTDLGPDYDAEEKDAEETGAEAAAVPEEAFAELDEDLSYSVAEEASDKADAAEGADSSEAQPEEVDPEGSEAAEEAADSAEETAEGESPIPVVAAAAAGEACSDAAEADAESQPEEKPLADDPHAAEKSPVPEAGSVPGSVPPPAQPKKNRAGLFIGIIAAAILALLIGCALYMQFFVPREIHVSDATLELSVGDTAKLSYTIVPSGADNLEVAWASSNESVASIDEFGVVTAVGGGSCAIAVATGNGKTDICVVTVIDPAQIQKESLQEVFSILDKKETTKELSQEITQELKEGSAQEGSQEDSQEDGAIEVWPVEEIDENHYFLMGEDNNSLYLLYSTTDDMDEMGVSAEYTTIVKLNPENLDTAEVTQCNTVYLYNLPITMIGTGLMNISSYQHGDKVPLSNTSSTVNGLDASEALHELTDEGSTICLDKFAKVLSDEGLDITLEDFGFTNYGAVEAAPAEETGEETVDASAAQESWDTISEEETASIAEDAAVSTAEEATESKAILDSIAEENGNLTTVEAEPVEAESVSAETENESNTPGTEEVSDQAVADPIGSRNEEETGTATISEFPNAGHGFSLDIARESLSVGFFTAIRV